MSFRYQSLANELMSQIKLGAYQIGERLPGVRAMSGKRGVSIATVLSAYKVMEDAGFIEARNRSGYYVAARKHAPAVVHNETESNSPVAVTGQQMVLAMTKAASDPRIVQFGAAIADPAYLPGAAVNRALQRTIKQQRTRSISNYEMAPGAPELRQQIARRMCEFGGGVSPNEMVITCGCQEALRLSLRAVTEPGDVVAIESPAFYGALQVLEALRLKALEIPTDPEQGMSPEALALAMDNWPVKAVLVVPNNQNPLGFTMSDARKKQLVAVAQTHGVPIVEDDIFGDLSFSATRPLPIKTLCPDADIIYCSSFSKTVGPGLRVGWVAGGKHHQRVEFLKYVSNVATSSLSQLTLANYLASGGHDRYLRKAATEYRLCVDRMTELLTSLLPDGTAITQPQGGYVLWLQLPQEVNTFTLANRLLKRSISIAPGAIFSASDKYHNCMRISCACVWDSKVKNALFTLGEEVQKLMR